MRMEIRIEGIDLRRAGGPQGMAGRQGAATRLDAASHQAAAGQQDAARRQDGTIACVHAVCRCGFTLLKGPNGSGKSRLLQLLAGIAAPAAGRIRYYYRGSLLPTSSQRLMTGYMPQELAVYEQLTVHHYLRYIAGLKCLPPEKAAREAFALLGPASGLAGLQSARLGELSAGQQRLAMLAQALLGAPAFLLLDEPFEHLDIRQRTEVIELLGHLGRTCVIVIASHIDSSGEWLPQEAERHSQMISL